MAFNSSDVSKIGIFKKLEIPKINNGKRSNYITEWFRKLKSPIIITEIDAISAVKFSNSSPFNYLSAYAAKISLFDGNTDDLIRIYSDFRDKVLALNYRNDGKLFCGSDQNGYIQIFDEQNSKGHALRKIRAHDKAVYVCKFSPNTTQLFSASDDLKWKLWDIASSSVVLSRDAHADYIRCSSTLDTNSNLWFTGSYDHSVKLWDTRCAESKPNLSVIHNQPVEDILVHPNGLLLLSCGGNTIRLWDLANGGKPLHQITSHVKTITNLTFSHDCSYFHSASLDRNVKSYSMQTYEILNSVRYDLPILSMDISPNNQKMLVGMIDSTQNNGLMYLKRYPKRILDKNGANDELASSSTYNSHDQFNEEPRKFTRYFDTKAFAKEHKIEVVKKPLKNTFTKYEHFLKKFEHIKAIKYVFDEKYNIPASIIVEVLREIMRRSALVITLQGCHASDVIRILNFVAENIMYPQYTQVLTKFSHVFLDNEPEMLHLQRKLSISHYRESYCSAINRLNDVLRRQIDFITKSYEVIGHLDLIELLSSIPKSMTSSTSTRSQECVPNTIDILADTSNSKNTVE